MNQQNISNILLSIIAVLLLIMVLQNQGPRANYSKSAPPAYPQESAQTQDPHAGHNHGPNVSHNNDPHAGEFNPSEMVYAALNCPSNQSTALADTSCDGKIADERRKMVDEAFAKGLTISKVFDAVIEKYGMPALTPEAQEIIKSRNQ